MLTLTTKTSLLGHSSLGLAATHPRPGIRSPRRRPKSRSSAAIGSISRVCGNCCKDFFLNFCSDSFRMGFWHRPRSFLGKVCFCMFSYLGICCLKNVTSNSRTPLEAPEATSWEMWHWNTEKLLAIIENKTYYRSKWWSCLFLFSFW